MKRRAFLALGTCSLVGLAGCTSPSDSGDTATSQTGTTTATQTESGGSTTTGETTETAQEIGDDGTTTGATESDQTPSDVTSNPDDPEPADGYPPEQDSPPAERQIDTSSYETLTYEGQEVKLAPIEDVYYWWARREARFADARGTNQYRDSHIYGAVSSPAGSPIADSDVADWGKDQRIVCYCGCPHHLSSIRAAELQEAGYSDVYVLDEGYYQWLRDEYPVVGEDTSSRKLYRIQGQTSSKYAGEMVWARHVGSDRMEAAPVQGDGSFELHIRFADVTPRSEVVVETPAFSVRGTLSELSSTVVTQRLG
ncbi:rhodanese-like domain-containing protein [Haloarchaeobius sp. DFWS5]|uniref:rhodanese-like domain-containing protein n=1 Tax=Haloarchaeobius sp. DFWS5 TaxID=3446114 RepID=UPI003EBE8429